MIRESHELRQHIPSQCDSSRVGTESLERVGETGERMLSFSSGKGLGLMGDKQWKDE